MFDILKNIGDAIAQFMSSIGRVFNLIGDAMSISTNLFDHSIFPAAIVSLFMIGLSVAMIYKLVGRT